MTLNRLVLELRPKWTRNLTFCPSRSSCIFLCSSSSKILSPSKSYLAKTASISASAWPRLQKRHNRMSRTILHVNIQSLFTGPDKFPTAPAGRIYQKIDEISFTEQVLVFRDLHTRGWSLIAGKPVTPFREPSLALHTRGDNRSNFVMKCWISIPHLIHLASISPGITIH